MARARPKAGSPLSEAELTMLLAQRFAAPEYAFMPQVRNGTGWSRRTARTADAVAMSLWPSRGLELLGFEIKSDRSDWLREKTNPEKAEEIGKFCDRWWVVTGAEDVVRQDDLFPPTWGLMVAAGGKLRVVRDAPRLKAKPIDREQLAAILRRAAECVVPKAQLDAIAEERIKRAEQVAEDALEARIAQRTLHLQRELERIKARAEKFEKASGISLDDWQLGEVGKATRFLASGGLEGLRIQLEGWRERLGDLGGAIDALLAFGTALPKTGTGGG